MRKTKGFTLVELLVVISIIALLMAILMPALAKVRSIAFRMTCGTNLAGIGKATLIYANDYEEEFPRAGFAESELSTTGILKWDADTRVDAYGIPPDCPATITSCIYLLLKFADVTPKSVICKNDGDVEVFELGEHTDQMNPAKSDFELINAWDFGQWVLQTDSPDNHCSYAYHHPFSIFALTTSSEPGMAVAADPNPWRWHAGQEAAKEFPGNEFIAGPYGSIGPFDPDQGSRNQIRYGNSIVHQEEGQNVLFLDGHVSFEKVAFCGIEEDNIYTALDPTDTNRRMGMPDPFYNQDPQPAFRPGYRTDSFLINNVISIP